MLRTFKSRVVRRTFWLIKVVPTWKKFEKRWSIGHKTYEAPWGSSPYHFSRRHAKDRQAQSNKQGLMHVTACSDDLILLHHQAEISDLSKRVLEFRSTVTITCQTTGIVEWHRCGGREREREREKKKKKKKKKKATRYCLGPTPVCTQCTSTSHTISQERLNILCWVQFIHIFVVI
jgi:hypothetical protein